MSGGHNRLTWTCRECGTQFHGRRNNGKDRIYCSNVCRAKARRADDGVVRPCGCCGETKPLSAFIWNGKTQRWHAHCRPCRAQQHTAARRAKGIQPRDQRRRVVTREVKALRAFAKAIAHRWVSLARPMWGRPHKPTGPALLSRARYHFDPKYRAMQVEKRHRRDVATLNASDGSITKQVVYQLFSRTKVCGYCGKSMAYHDKSLDHLVPISRGGLHSIENVEVVCLQCNKTKHCDTALEFLMKAA